jgi:hypothetical protein
MQFVFRNVGSNDPIAQREAGVYRTLCDCRAMVVDPADGLDQGGEVQRGGGRSWYGGFTRHGKILSFQIPQSGEEPIEHLEGCCAFGFQSAAGDGVFVPEVFEQLDQLAFGGIEVAVEFVAGEVVEFG